MAYVDEDDNSAIASSDCAECLRWNYCLGHMLFPKLKKLALSNFIPKRLANPKFLCCIYGAMTTQPWRTKSKLNKGCLQAENVPGDCILVYQLQSSTLGFMAQLKRRLTRERHTSAIALADH
eukprot:1440951-Ditylum_brightwellii.AAC.1